MNIIEAIEEKRERAIALIERELYLEAVSYLSENIVAGQAFKVDTTRDKLLLRHAVEGSSSVEIKDHFFDEGLARARRLALEYDALVFEERIVILSGIGSAMEVFASLKDIGVDVGVSQKEIDQWIDDIVCDLDLRELESQAKKLNPHALTIDEMRATTIWQRDKRELLRKR